MGPQHDCFVAVGGHPSILSAPTDSQPRAVPRWLDRTEGDLMAGLFERAKEFASSEQGEKVTDGVLDKAAAAASKLTGGKHDEQIDSARDTADKHVGAD